jgi:hypothetical protein
MAAVLLGDKKAGDLTLHLRRHYGGPWLCQRLNSGRSVWRITINLTRRIDHYRTGFDADACAKRWFARTGILAVDLSKRALNGQGGPRCAFSVVFLRHRMAE